MAHTPQEQVINEDSKGPISLRDVEKQVWKDFRRLAAIHDMTLQQYLAHIVKKELAHVQVGNG